MDRKTLLAVILCFLIFFGWQKLYIEPRLPKQAPVSQTAPSTGIQGQQTAPPVAQAAPTATQSSGAEAPAVPQQTETIPTSIGEAVVSNGKNVFENWKLKAYRKDIAPEAASVDLSSVTNQPGQLSLAFDDPAYAYLETKRGNLTKTEKGLQWIYEDDKVRLTREISSSGQPFLDVNFTAQFKAQPPKFAFVTVANQGSKEDPGAQDRSLIYWAKDSHEKVAVREHVETTHVPFSTRYIGASTRYFLMAAVPQGSMEPKALIQPIGPYAARASLVYPVNGNSISIPVRAFFGPKELDTLRAVDPKLDHAVDFGMFTIVAYPLLRILRAFYSFFQNYGVAIILLTLLLKVATYPLTFKSMKSMKEMAKLQPQLQRIREKHKDDREALNREMMTVMRSHGYNPLAGCLPILIQMPVFFALYRVLYSSIELYQAPFALWIHDLSSRDPYYVTPVLMTVTMFIQQKLQPSTATDPAQQKMLQLMPLIFGAFMLTLPSGLTLYMLVNAVASIVQQLILNKKLGITPHATPVAGSTK